MYSEFAYVYDRLMDDIQYSKWADYIEALFVKYGRERPELVLDLACGTGSLTLEMAKRGYDMIGIDMSSDMLSCAMEKAVPFGVLPLWVCQDMRSFELYGTMDAIICTMDSLNYIVDLSDLKEVFHLVNNYLNPNGLFIFDINTPYKLEHVLGNNFFYEIRQDITYLWENSYHVKDKICTFSLTFFVREEGDIYHRLEEEQRQKAWTLDEICSALVESGLSMIDVFDAFTFSASSKTTERQFFIARKPV